MYPEFLQFWCNVIHCKSAYKKTELLVFLVYLSMFVMSHFHLKIANLKDISCELKFINFVYCLKFIRLRPDLSKQMKISKIKRLCTHVLGNCVKKFIPLAS